jgi:hypothetical protein
MRLLARGWQCHRFYKGGDLGYQPGGIGFETLKKDMLLIFESTTDVIRLSRANNKR